MSRPIHVVVVAYHAPEALGRCLEHLEDAFPVTVVDNSSSATVRAIAEGHPAAVTYLDPGRNLGFAGGVNTGLRRCLSSGPTDVLLLNPDATLAADDVDHLARELRSPRCSDIAAISPELVGPMGEHQRVAWPFPSPSRAWIEAVGLGTATRARETFVIGAALLLRWEALQEVGLFDERFFLYAEEADWQRRAYLARWRSAVCPDVVAVHTAGASSDNAIRREALFHAGQETYIRKWFGHRGWLVYRTATVAGAGVRACVLRGDRRTEAIRRAGLYLRGPSRCLRVYGTG